VLKILCHPAEVHHPVVMEEEVVVMADEEMEVMVDEEMEAPAVDLHQVVMASEEMGVMPVDLHQAMMAGQETEAMTPEDLPLAATIRKMIQHVQNSLQEIHLLTQMNKKGKKKQVKQSQRPANKMNLPLWNKLKNYKNY